MKNQRREAIMSSLWFQKGKTIQETQEELNKIERTIHSTPDINFLNIFQNARMIKPLIIYCVIVISRMGTGYLIIIHYTFSVFESLKNHFNVVNLALFTVILNFAFTISFPTLIKRYERKTIFCASSTVMIVAISFVIVYEFMLQKDSMSFPWMPVTCLFVYMTMNIAFFDPVVSVMLSEIFPKSVNSFTSWLHHVIEYKLAIIYIFNFPSIKSNYGIQPVLWFFLVNTVVCFVMVMNVLPRVCNPKHYERTNLFDGEANSTVIDQQELLQSMIDEESAS